MANISSQMDSVFDDGLDFDVIFDDDDKLIDTVTGVKEDGTSLLGDEYEGFFDENGDFLDDLISEGDDFSIPGEPSTDDGKADNTAGKSKLLDRTTTTGCPSHKDKLTRDAESDGTSAYPNSSEASVDDMESVGQFRKGLGYTSEAEEPNKFEKTLEDEENNNNECGSKNCKESVDIDKELFDESAFLASSIDDELFDESLLQYHGDSPIDTELYNENFILEADEKDEEEDLIEEVEDNDSSSGSNLDYEVGEDDVMLDSLM